MKSPEDFNRVGDLLGDFCEAAASPSSSSTQPSESKRFAGKAAGGASSDPARALATAWPDIAGEEVAANASPVQLKAGRLVVSTSSSVWAHTLQYMGEDLMARLNSQLGAGTVQRIVFRHAGWEERWRGEPTASHSSERPGPAKLSSEQEQALAQVEDLDLPPAVREKVSRAMRASFVRGQQDRVR
jgi:hypothetical protein